MADAESVVAEGAPDSIAVDEAQANVLAAYKGALEEDDHEEVLGAVREGFPSDEQIADALATPEEGTTEIETLTEVEEEEDEEES